MKRIKVISETSDLALRKNLGYCYSFGLVGFEIVAEEATVKIIYHEAGDLTGYVYRKFGPTEPGGTNVWYTFDATISGNVVSLNLKDNELGDSNTEYGIVDPGDIAQPVSVSAPATTSYGLIALISLIIAISILTMHKRSP